MEIQIELLKANADLNLKNCYNHDTWNFAKLFVVDVEFENTVRMTVEWYKNYYQGERQDMQEFTSSQIKEYMNLAKEKEILWAIEQ